MFAKVFSQILDSSIAEDHEVRHTFEDMLKLCDLNGVVDMTHESIARRVNVPIEIIIRCITELEKPDPDSRTKDHEGRRIVRIDKHRDWGWFIVNYNYYRNIASEEQRREKTKVRTQKWRKKQPVTPSDAPVTPRDASDAMQMQREKKKHREGEGEPRCSVAHLSILDIKDIIAAKKEKAQEIKHRFSSEVAMGTNWSDDGKRKEHRSLRSEIKNLESEIAQRA